MSIEITAFGYEQNLPVSDRSAIIARTVNAPEPLPHDLIVRVKAVSVNPVDVKQRASSPSDGFRVLGFDASGVVEQVGSEVTLFNPGDEVFYAGAIDRAGSNQQLQAVDERLVGRKPRSLTHADAAALPLTTLTAWEAMFDRLGIKPDSDGTLLVVGGSGGVGSILIQLVDVLAPRVRIVSTASRADSVDWVTKLGADATVNHRQDIAAQVGEQAPGGVDWLFSSHSDGEIETYAQIVKPFGQIVAIDDGERDVAPLKSKSISWHWEFMFSHALHVPESHHQHEILDHVSELVDAHVIKTTTTKVLRPLSADTIREGHRLVEDGHVTGKVVITDEPG